MASKGPASLNHVNKSSTPWEVKYVDPTRQEGSGRAKRVTKYFASKEAAEDYLDALNEDLMIGGITAAHMDQVQRGDYSAARRLLDAHGMTTTTLLSLAQSEVDRCAKANHRKALDVLDEFIEEQRAHGRSEETISSLEIRCKAWIAREAILWVSEITKEKLKSPTKRMDVSATTRRNDLAALSSWCSWLASEGYLEWNPVKAIRKPMPERKPPHIWTPAQAGRMLEAAAQYAGGAHRWTIGVLILGGVRPSEVPFTRLIDDKQPKLRVEGGKLKGAANRLVPITPGAAKWLADAKASPFTRTARLEILSRAQTKEDPFTWEHDSPRHSWISYRYATNDNKAKTAKESGNSEAIIDRHYYRLVTKQAAKAFFALPALTQ